MKGGHVHDLILLKGIWQQLLAWGASVETQVFSSSESGRGFIDLTARLPCGRLIAIEVEMTTRRILNDVRKAIDLGADELWIVVPNAKVREASKRCLRDLESNKQVQVSVLTQSEASQRLSNCFPLS